MFGRKLTIGLLIAALSVLGFSCNTDDDGAHQLAGQEITAEQVEPFAPDHLPGIQGNGMHERHFANGVHCGECHLSTQPMPVANANETCRLCHDQSVSDPIWENHCLTCHHFTQSAQDAGGDPQMLVESLCSACHSETEEGGKLYASCAHLSADSEVHIFCDRCHRPHEDVPTASGALCDECHPEHRETRHLATDTADCSLCHRPHRPQQSGAELCTTCHAKADDVLVHNVPSHPSDCLVCHPPHFVTIEITAVCSDCHEGMEYNGGQNQPPEHKDCANCHAKDTFDYLGSQSCANCHWKEGSVIDNRNVARVHRNCLTCHPPHSWRAPYRQNCTNCHEVSDVFEHQVDFHPKECDACHNPHNPGAMPASGDCDACHELDRHVPSFDQGAPEMHLLCGNCHEQTALDAGEFRFIGTGNSCLICHATALAEPELSWEELPAPHQYCIGCHEPHMWGALPDTESCAACHVESHEAENMMHVACYNCHARDHSLEFQGVEATCQLCHYEPPGTHASSGHTDCMNCHVSHGFKADTEACLMCHSDMIEGHYYDPAEEVFCVDCHTFSE